MDPIIFIFVMHQVKGLKYGGRIYSIDDFFYFEPNNVEIQNCRFWRIKKWSLSRPKKIAGAKRLSTISVNSNQRFYLGI
jgi:hypothetical protein